MKDNLFGCYEIKAGTKTIADWAFNWYEDLTVIVIPESVTSIGEFAFSDCSSLTSIVIPDSGTSIVYRVFEGCERLVEVTIPESVETIEAAAFEYCDNLKNVYFENTENWSVNGTELSSEDLTDPEKAAEYLRETYCEFTWSQNNTSYKKSHRSINSQNNFWNFNTKGIKNKSDYRHYYHKSG